MFRVCYSEPEYRTLAIDVGFYISHYISQDEHVPDNECFHQII